MRIHAGLCLILLLVIQVASAAEETPDVRVQSTHASRAGEYAKHDEGWFFYKDPLESEKKKPIPVPVPTEKKPANETVGSVAWIRDHIDAIRDRAIDYPTKENLELFAYVQKMMMDKSEIFATKFVQTTNQDPALDEGINNPRSSVAKSEQYAQIDEAFDRILHKLSQDVALWYFFRSDCPYCAKEDPILSHYIGKYGFSILPISTDGAPLADGSFPDWIPDQGQATYLNVNVTPTIYLVHPPKDVILLSVGLKAGREMTERIIDIAHDQKWITDDEYDDAVKGLPHKYLTTAFDPSKIADPENPEELLKAFRASGTFSAKSADLESIANQTGGSTPIHSKNN